jgi:outer membrane autotransporter protein
MALNKSETDFDLLKADIDSKLLLAGAAAGYQDFITDSIGYRLLGSLTVGHIRNEYTRSVGVQFPQAHSGTFNQNYLNLDLDFNLDFHLSQRTVLSPRLDVSYLRASQDGLNESSAANRFTALTTETIRTDSVQTYLGLGLAHSFALSELRALSLSAATGWLHQFGDVNPVSRGYFSGAPSASFVTRTSDHSRDALAVEANLELINTTGRGLGLSLGYSAQLAKKQARHQFSFGLNYSF